MIGQAGRLIELVRTPAGAAVLVMLIAAIAMSGNSKRKKKRSQRAVIDSANGSWLQGNRGPTMTTAAAAACAFLLLGGFAFTRPTERTDTAKVPYTEAGRFSYEGKAEKGPVYPTGRVATGEPIYLQLVNDLRFGFDYSLETSAEHDVSGSGSFTAALSDGNGWSRRFALASERDFEGDRWSVAGILHLSDVKRLVGQVQKATGVYRDFYTLSIVPDVSVEGTIDGRRFSSEFAPPLSFQVGALEMQVSSDSAASSSTPAQGDALRPSQGGAVVAPFEVPNTFALGGMTLDVSKARLVSAAGSALSLALLALVGFSMRPSNRDEAAQIEARYGRMIVAVDSVTADPNASVVEVKAFEALVALARRYDRAVLHEEHDGRHRYVVENEGTIYSYRCEPAAEPEPSATPEEDVDDPFESDARFERVHS